MLGLCRRKTGCGDSATRDVPKSSAKGDVCRKLRHRCLRRRRATLGPRWRRRATGHRPYSDRRATVRQPSATRRLLVVASPTSILTSMLTVITSFSHRPRVCYLFFSCVFCYVIDRFSERTKIWTRLKFHVEMSQIVLSSEI